MAYLGFGPQLVRNFGLGGLSRGVKKKALHTAERYGAGFGMVSGRYEKGMGRIDEDAAELAKQAGNPGDEGMIAAAKDMLQNEHSMRATSGMNKLNAAYESVRDKAIANARSDALFLGLEEDKAAAFAEQSWDLSIRSPSIGDVFRQTALDRANALGITRFRATDGAMDTIDSLRSLLYKDNEHLSGKGKAALLGGGLTGAGALVGLGYSVSNG